MFLDKILPALIVFLLLGGGALLRLVQTEVHRRRNNAAEEVHTRATVLSKRMNCDNIAHKHLRDGGMVFYATFRTGDGATVELMMSRTQYGSLIKGNEGTLTYQGDQFLKFEPY